MNKLDVNEKNSLHNTDKANYHTIVDPNTLTDKLLGKFDLRLSTTYCEGFENRIRGIVLVELYVCSRLFDKTFYSLTT